MVKTPPATLTLFAELVELLLGIVQPGLAAVHFEVSRVVPLNSSAKTRRSALLGGVADANELTPAQADAAKRAANFAGRFLVIEMTGGRDEVEVELEDGTELTCRSHERMIDLEFRKNRRRRHG